MSQYRSLVASLCLPRDLVCFDKNAVDTNNHIKYMDCISGQKCRVDLISLQSTVFYIACPDVIFNLLPSTVILEGEMHSSSKLNMMPDCFAFMYSAFHANGCQRWPAIKSILFRLLRVQKEIMLQFSKKAATFGILIISRFIKHCDFFLFLFSSSIICSLKTLNIHLPVLGAMSSRRYLSRKSFFVI